MTGKIINRRVVPDKYVIYENDNNSKSLTFTTTTINDGVDIRNLYAYLSLQSEDYETNKMLLSKQIDGDTVTFSTTINSTISNSDGITRAQISFESSDLTIVYSTAIFFIEVKKSVDGYENTTVTPNSLFELQKTLTETVDGVEEKMDGKLNEYLTQMDKAIQGYREDLHNDFENFKNNVEVAPLTINGISYNGKTATEIKTYTRRIEGFPCVFESPEESSTNDLVIRGIYRHENDKDISSVGDGVNTNVVQGVGVVNTNIAHPHYGEALVRVRNSNGNFYEPVSTDEITNEGITVRPVSYITALEISAPSNTVGSVEVPIKQNFKPFGVYNLRIKYMVGTIVFDKGKVPIKISIINKDTGDKKSVCVDHACVQSIPMRNTANNFNVKNGEIAILVEVDTTSSGDSALDGIMISLIIEDSNYPLSDFVAREVVTRDIYIPSPLYSISTKDPNASEEEKDELSDVLDLKTGTIKRYIKMQTVNASDLTENVALNCYTYSGPNKAGLSTTGDRVLDRPSLGVVSPKNPTGTFGECIESGFRISFSKQELGEFGKFSSQCPFTIFYPLRVPKTESFNSVNIPIRKGLNVIDVEGDFNCRLAVLKI